MRLVKIFGLAALAAVAAMAFVGVTSAPAAQLCNEHVDLECPEAGGAGLVHLHLVTGTVGRLLSSLVTVLCLLVLVHVSALALGNPQSVHGEIVFEGCGTNAAHSNCTVTVEEQPLSNLVKTGLDTGSLTATNGRTRLQCPNLGLDCKYDTEGLLFSAGAQHVTANETKVTELGGKFFCPDEGKLDGLLKSLLSVYILH